MLNLKDILTPHLRVVWAELLQKKQVSKPLDIHEVRDQFMNEEKLHISLWRFCAVSKPWDHVRN